MAPGCQSFQVQEMESTATPSTQSSNEVISSVSPGEIKIRKKEKIRTLREQALQEKDTKQTSQLVPVVSLSSALQI